MDKAIDSKCILNTIINDNEQDMVWDRIALFLNLTEERFTFPELSSDLDFKKLVWSALYNKILQCNDPVLLCKYLRVVRILSRDKLCLEDAITEDWILLLLRNTDLNDNYLCDETVSLETKKILCNVVFNNKFAACAPVVMQVLDKSFLSIQSRWNLLSYNNRLYNLKLLFLITALNVESRAKLCRFDTCIECFLTCIKGVLVEDEIIKANNCDILNEILKVLFNITIHMDDCHDKTSNQIVNVCGILLHCTAVTPECDHSLKSNTINLLTNLPTASLNLLIVEADRNAKQSIIYESHDLTAIQQVLAVLRYKLHNGDDDQAPNEILSPAISVLLRCAQVNRFARKYLRSEILPPLNDVHSRPEKGTTLRNHLCKLLTSPIQQLSDLTAELIFIICKRNVNRMIKYTGYGNAAGLFAQHGLLDGRANKSTNISSDSEDSETDEYAEYKSRINPVIGCYEPTEPSPLSDMSDEQKEYEAMKLVKLLDDLTRKSSIRPCTIGEDGKPQPIEHVLELQNNLTHPKQEEADSD